MNKLTVLAVLLLASCGGGTSSSNKAPLVTPLYGTASLSWTAPTEYTDNSALTDLAGFKVYYSENESALDEKIIIHDALKTYVIIENLSYGHTYYFAVTAFNSLGTESEYSDIAVLEN